MNISGGGGGAGVMIDTEWRMMIRHQTKRNEKDSVRQREPHWIQPRAVKVENRTTKKDDEKKEDQRVECGWRRAGDISDNHWQKWI